MYTLNFFFLLIATVTPLFGRRLGAIFSIRLVVFFLFLCVLLNFFILKEVAIFGYTCEVFFFNWLDIFEINISFSFYYDKLSSTMVFLVTFISFLVHIYSSNYMEHDPGKIRFFFFLSLFTFFMCLMVVSSSMLQFFMAWEGVGLSSYLLINFWYTRAEANRSAMKALIVNRFGDFGLYIAILLVFVNYKTLSFITLNSFSYLIPYSYNIFELFFFQINIIEAICFFFFLGVIGKSAQLGLHTWLPDAMEGPTPVSALLHAATMVTAGVFLLLRISHTLEFAPKVLMVVAFLGAFTAFFASSVGAFQQDIKKIIAYSTCSQLGYMVASCGLHNFGGAYFHLFNHAFFKALLFLGAGSIIHSLLGEQDLRKYGGLTNLIPFTYFIMFVGSLSLIGVPFMSGFYSKESLINWAFETYTYNGIIVYWFFIFATFFTSYYSCKIMNLTFFTTTGRFNGSTLPTIKESDIRICLPLFLLAVLSITGGFYFYDLFVGYGTNINGVAINLNTNFYLEVEYLGQLRKILPLVAAGLGCIIYFTFFFIFSEKYKNFILFRKICMQCHPLWLFFVKKWYFDFFYFWAVKAILEISYKVLFKNIDKGLIEFVFVRKPIFKTIILSNYVKELQSSQINNYLIILFIFSFLPLFFVFALIFFFNIQFLLLIIFYIIYVFILKCEK